MAVGLFSLNAWKVNHQCSRLVRVDINLSDSVLLYCSWANIFIREPITYLYIVVNTKKNITKVEIFDKV